MTQMQTPAAAQTSGQNPPSLPPQRSRPTEAIADRRVPPQDLGAEASLLGCMLLDKESVGLVLRIIPREEAQRFYRPDHCLLFETLIDLYDRNQPIDIIVLEDELRRLKRLDEIGGRDYLLDLVRSVPSSANAEYYAHIVRDKEVG